MKIFHIIILDNVADDVTHLSQIVIWISFVLYSYFLGLYIFNGRFAFCKESEVQFVVQFQNLRNLSLFVSELFESLFFINVAFKNKYSEWSPLIFSLIKSIPMVVEELRFINKQRSNIRNRGSRLKIKKNLKMWWNLHVLLLGIAEKS